VLLAGLVGLGLWLLQYLGDGVLREHSYAVRGELQDPHFDTDWLDNVAGLPSSTQ